MSEKVLLTKLIKEVKKSNELLEEIRDSLSSIDSDVRTLHDIEVKLEAMQARLASIETSRMRIRGRPEIV